MHTTIPQQIRKNSVMEQIPCDILVLENASRLEMVERHINPFAQRDNS